MDQIRVQLQETMGSDESIANAAWTSTYDKDVRDSKYNDKDKVNKLIRRLILEKHGTPIESVIFRFWIRMPIFTDRQHVTHRIASHSGLSGRYRTMPIDFYEIPNDVNEILDSADLNYFKDAYYAICDNSYAIYNEFINRLKEVEIEGVIDNAQYKRAREVFRGILPISGMTERTTIMNLRSFANYQKQRNSDHAQPEIKRVAELMLEEVENSNICPVAISTLKEVGWEI